MTQKFTAEEVRKIATNLDDLVAPITREGNIALNRAAAALRDYADSLMVTESDEYAEMQRKARCWDDLQRAKAEASITPDNSSWKEVARRQGLISGVKACRSAHGFSLMEARDCVEEYLRDEQEKQ